MSESFIRLFRLLQLIPRAPRSVDTATIEAILIREGFYGVRRTLQRDLVKLERMGLGLECLSDSKPYRWRFIGGAPLPHVGGGQRPARGGRKLALTLRLDETARTVLMRAPLASGQRITTGRDRDFVLEAEVVDGPALRRQIVALGPHVEVVSPAALRKAVAEAHRTAWAQYAERVG